MTEVKRTRFAMVPVWVYRHPQITPTTLHVYLAVAVRAYDRKTRVSIAELQSESGLGRAAVYGALAILREAGAIVDDGGAWFLPMDPADDPSTTMDTDPDDSTTVDDPSTTMDKVSTTVESHLPSIETSVEGSIEKKGAELALVELPEVVRSSPHLLAARELCAMLERGLVERGHKVEGHSTRAAWVQPMELMLRKDGRHPAKVARMIEMLHAATVKPFDFWQANVLSPATLRAQYARIAEQFASHTRGASRNPAIHRPDEPSLADVLAIRDVSRGTIDAEVREA